MPATFLAPIFQNAAGTGLSSAGRAAAGYLFRVVGDQAVRMVVDAGLGLLVDTAEEAAALTAEQLSDFAPESLVRFLGISCPGINEDEVVINRPATERIVNALNEMDRGETVLAEFFDTLNEGFEFAIDLAASIAGISEVGGCALGILRADNDLVATRKFPDGSGAPARIRQCNRASSDGARVSREVHEWEYCRQNQWGDVMAEAQQWGQRVLDAVANGDEPEGNLALPPGLTVQMIADAVQDENISFATSDYTFGNFVDGKLVRRGIEQFRRVNRSVTGARFTDLFNLLGMSRDEVRSQINNSSNWGTTLLGLILLNVSPDSGQDGNADVDA